MAAITGRFTGSPVRAASRSTTWTHALPAVGEQPRPAPPGSSPYTVSWAKSPWYKRTHRRPQVDRRVQLHQRSESRHSSTKFASSARPVALDFSGWNCVAHTLLALDHGGDRAAVVTRGDHVGRVGVGGVRVHEVDPRRVGQAAEQRATGARRRARSTASAGASRRRAGGGCAREHAEAGRRRGSRPTRRTASACRCRCRGTARPRRPRRARPRRGRRRAAPPCTARTRRRPGSTTPAASAIRPGRR